MPKKAGVEKWKKKRRQEHLELKKYRYYVFCEGQQTEPQYFTGFKKLIEENPVYKDMVLIQIEPCQAETMRVIGMAEDYVKKNKIKRIRSCSIIPPGAMNVWSFGSFCILHKSEKNTLYRKMTGTKEA